jgi:hypothetical protein
VHPKWHPRGRWLNFEDAAAVLSKAWCLHISMLSLLLCAATGLTPSGSRLPATAPAPTAPPVRDDWHLTTLLLPV